jgi:hypothetical protein
MMFSRSRPPRSRPSERARARRDCGLSQPWIRLSPRSSAGRLGREPSETAGAAGVGNCQRSAPRSSRAGAAARRAVERKSPPLSDHFLVARRPDFQAWSLRINANCDVRGYVERSGPSRSTAAVIASMVAALTLHAVVRGRSSLAEDFASPNFGNRGLVLPAHR